MQESDPQTQRSDGQVEDSLVGLFSRDLDSLCCNGLKELNREFWLI